MLLHVSTFAGTTQISFFPMQMNIAGKNAYAKLASAGCGLASKYAQVPDS
jgi:hypothetical protein